MTVVCGIDVGSLRTPADVAWLDGERFVFARYVPSAAEPLPEPPHGVGDAACFALDAPQSLPAAGSARRAADRDAGTPIRVLPATRTEVEAMRAYGPFVEAGLTIFWAAHLRALPVVETYPRFVIRTLWPDLKIPSKRKETRRYVAELWARIRMLGYSSRPPGTHDEIDAMLCALAAEAVAAGRDVQVGSPVVVDDEDGVLREGFIVVPGRRGEAQGDDVGFLQERSYARADAALRRSWPPEQAMGRVELAAFLDTRRFCVFTTTTRRGQAQARPVAFSFWRGSFWIATVDGGRLRNARRLPWASLVVMDGEQGEHRAVAVDGPLAIREAPPEALLVHWEHRHGSRPDWAAAWIELRPERLFSYAGAP